MANGISRCPACSGKVVDGFGGIGNGGFTTRDQTGVCETCGAVELVDRCTCLVQTWCTCADQTDAVYFWHVGGGHGWMHRVCGQIVQVG